MASGLLVGFSLGSLAVAFFPRVSGAGLALALLAIALAGGALLALFASLCFLSSLRLSCCSFSFRLSAGSGAFAGGGGRSPPPLKIYKKL